MKNLTSPEPRPIGIPYASHARNARGQILPNKVVCPICQKKITLTSKKDFESYSNDAYAKHYAAEHAP